MNQSYDLSSFSNVVSLYDAIALNEGAALTMIRQQADTDMNEISSLNVSTFALANEPIVSLYDDNAPEVPAGYVRVVHSYRTVYQRADEPIAYTPSFSFSHQ